MRAAHYDLKRTQEVQKILLSALTGRTVLLPTDDAAEYERHIRAYQDELNPVGQRESDLVKDCANCAIASLPTAGGSSLTRSDPSWE